MCAAVYRLDGVADARERIPQLNHGAIEIMPQRLELRGKRRCDFRQHVAGRQAAQAFCQQAGRLVEALFGLGLCPLLQRDAVAVALFPVGIGLHFQFAFTQRGLAEDFHGTRHFADFVTATCPRHVDGEIAAGKAHHRFTQARNRTGDPLGDHDQAADAGQKGRQEDREINECIRKGFGLS